MPQVVTFHSFRRGTGKSTLAANTAVLCALRGLRVGLVDLNLESPSMAYILNLSHIEITYHINDFIWQQCSIDQAAYDITDHISQADQAPLPGRLFVVPASALSSDASRVLKGNYNYEILGDGFEGLITHHKLDILIIDTRAGLNDDTIFTIALSDTLLVIIRPDHQDYQGTAVTLDIARRLDVPQVRLIANDIPHSITAREMAESLEDNYASQVAAVIPFSEEVSTSHSEIFVLRYPDHPITQSLQKIIDAIILKKPTG
ncbi:MAG: MinD/ParA family protein [Anaerolineales bacterium]|nr:MinD/ParA family protein [Anaerolineales bacterium]